MIYFNEISNLDQAKLRYRDLAKKHHPDLGGDLVIMQLINKEYAYICAKICKEGEKTNTDFNKKYNQFDESENFGRVIIELMKLPNLIIEINGSWVMVTGDTKPVKDQIKALGLFWSTDKQGWRYRPEEEKCWNPKGSKTQEAIRVKYGTETMYSKKQYKLS